MRILFLDDRESRHRIFIEINPNHEIEPAYTVEKAVNLLECCPSFDVVCLDHDLGGGIYLPSDEKSGFAVAQHIVSMDRKKQPAIVLVHSWNEEGALNMLKLLREADIQAFYEPFSDNFVIGDNYGKRINSE
ncbi:MAG: cyclic-phosphate processing receiver domain-containing protein [Elusimicrobiota bacterium]